MITTERLILRAPEAGDLAWQQTWLNTPAVLRHLDGEALPADRFAAGFADNAAAMARGEPAFWMVMLRDGGALVGKCGLSQVEQPPAPPALSGGVQVGWTLAEAYWGKGLASEAARAAIGYGFDRLGLGEIWGQTSDSNLASTRLMARLGFARCAELDYIDPGYPAVNNPTTVYRLLRETWAEAA